MTKILYKYLPVIVMVFMLLTGGNSCKKSDSEFTDTEGSEVGYLAPGFTLNDLNGNPVSLSDFSGTIVLVEFWASWCGYCTQEIDELNEIYNDFDSQNFEIIGLSIDKNPADWKNKVAEKNIKYTQVNDPAGFDSDVVDKYNVGSIPKMFLVNEEGNIIFITNSADEVRNKLTSLLNQSI